MLDEFIRYDLVIPDQPMDQTPQRCILLETKSQLESLKRHFVHWNLSGPTVKCQVSNRYHIGQL